MEMDEEPDIDMKLLILDDVNMTENDLELGVCLMRHWFSTQHHLPNCALDDNMLKAFIISSKSVERAKFKIEVYFKTRLTFYDPFFCDRDPSRIKWNSCSKSFFLPGLTKKGYRVVMSIAPPKEASIQYSFIEACRYGFMLLDYNLRHHFMNSGIFFVSDMANFSPEFLVKFRILLTCQANTILQDGFPLRFKGLVLFNAPLVAETFFDTFVQPFFSFKHKFRLFVNSSDHRCLQKHGIPLEMLPKDYEGGRSPSSDEIWEKTQKILERDRDWYLTHGSRFVDELLRHKPMVDELVGKYRQLWTE